jgi:hypothetical protein
VTENEIEARIEVEIEADIGEIIKATADDGENDDEISDFFT